MATFDDATVGTSTNGTAPDFGLSKKSEPAIRTTKFGDGYEQRVGFGFNQSPKEWTLEWSNRTNADIAAIEAFFESLNGATSFTWTPPNDASSYKFVVSSWNTQFNYAGIATINATFRQVFEP